MWLENLSQPGVFRLFNFSVAVNYIVSITHYVIIIIKIATETFHTKLIMFIMHFWTGDVVQMNVVDIRQQYLTINYILWINICVNRPTHTDQEDCVISTNNEVILQAERLTVVYVITFFLLM